MPGWHDNVKDLVADGKLVLLGVTQEQHADRCLLFAQWQQINWPIVHDPINQLGSLAVPIVVAIDELGIVRAVNPKPDWLRNEFIEQKYTSDEELASSAETPWRMPKLRDLAREAANAPSTDAYLALGDACMLWYPSEFDIAVNAYNSALQVAPTPLIHFRLGVALRHRFESSGRQQSDFPRAVSHWTHAVWEEPNQYIWRRRLQQYGPRLDKPYPFYDWVQRATEEIAARGQTPVEIRYPLSGAEIAKPSKRFDAHQGEEANPDPRNKITRDEGEYVQMGVAVVPARVKAGENIRLHLDFRLTGKGVWNNEAEPLQVWIYQKAGWRPQRQLVVHSAGKVVLKPETTEARRVEVEFSSSPTAQRQSIKGFALYYVCDKTTGTCMLRRQDFAFHVNIR